MKQAEKQKEQYENFMAIIDKESKSDYILPNQKHSD